MRKIIFILLIITISCKPDKKETNGYTLTGIIDGEAYTDFIYLNYGDYKDSVRVINNRFEFSGFVKKPIQGWLHLKSLSTAAFLYIENSDIRLKTHYQLMVQNNDSINAISITDIEGSYTAKLEKRYKDFYQKNESQENFKNLLFSELTSLFKENPKHPFGGAILGELVSYNPVLSKKQFTTLYSFIDTTAQHKEDLEAIKLGFRNLTKYGIGSIFPSFNLPNQSSKEISLDQYKGKVILMDFWASWCGPCRIKHPKLIELNRKLENKNFEIISISTDADKDKWIEAIEKDELKWTNLWDPGEELLGELGIQAIPFNYLVDEQGIIIGVNLSIDNIKNLLTKKVVTNN